MVNWTLLWNYTVEEFWFLLKAPINHPQLFWVITPLLITLFILSFYFGKYIKESLGWNTALSNSIVLFFVGIDLLRTIYNYSDPPTFMQFIWHPLKVCVILFVMFEGFLLARLAFRHAAPQKFMFFIASPLPINLQAYVLAVLIYTVSDPTVYTVTAAVLLFIVLFIVLRLLQELEHLWFGHNSDDFEQAARKVKKKSKDVVKKVTK